jgi:hypothetical protein
MTTTDRPEIMSVINEELDSLRETKAGCNSPISSKASLRFSRFGESSRHNVKHLVFEKYKRSTQLYFTVRIFI